MCAVCLNPTYHPFAYGGRFRVLVLFGLSWPSLLSCPPSRQAQLVFFLSAPRGREHRESARPRAVQPPRPPTVPVVIIEPAGPPDFDEADCLSITFTVENQRTCPLEIRAAYDSADRGGGGPSDESRRSGRHPCPRRQPQVALCPADGDTNGEANANRTVTLRLRRPFRLNVGPWSSLPPAFRLQIRYPFLIMANRALM